MFFARPPSESQVVLKRLAVTTPPLHYSRLLAPSGLCGSSQLSLATVSKKKRLAQSSGASGLITQKRYHDKLKGDSLSYGLCADLAFILP